MEATPAQTVDPKIIIQLYEKDPENLTRDDLQTLVADLRAKRSQFMQEEQTKSMKEKRVKKKDAPKQLDLKDLGL